MINSIIEAISVALNEEFGEEYEMHMEEIKQDLKEPCFFISCLNPVTRLSLGKRYFRQNQFCIQYFPKTEDKQRECNETAERITWCLEYISVKGDLFRGTKMKAETIDGVLNFFVNYDCFVFRVEPEKTAMESYNLNSTVKESR